MKVFHMIMIRLTLFSLLICSSIACQSKALLLEREAIITEGSSNILKVYFPEIKDIKSTDGWYLVGGGAEIKKIVEVNPGETLVFELSDHVLPDDRFELYYYKSLGNAQLNASIQETVVSFKVKNEADSYSGKGNLYHVSPQGKNSNLGTHPDAPTTFEMAKNRVGPGDYILFERGHTYNTQVELIGKKGLKGLNIVLGYYGQGEAPVLSYPGDSPLVLSNCAYVQAVGFQVRPAKKKNGVRIDNGSSFCKLRSLHVVGEESVESLADPERIYGDKSGIIYSKFGGKESVRSNQCEVLHCYVDTFRDGIYGESPNACLIGFNRVKNIAEDGIRVIQGNADLTKVVYNEVTDWSDDAIDLYTGSNAIVEFNIIHDPMLPLRNGANNGIKGGGVYQARLGQPTSQNNIYRYNTIYNLPMRLGFSPAGITTNGCLSGEIYGNLCYNIEHNAIEITKSDAPTKSWLVYNNTALSSKANGLFVAPNNPDVKTYNNIFQGAKADIQVSENSSVGGVHNLLMSGKSNGNYKNENDIAVKSSAFLTHYLDENYLPKKNSMIIDKGFVLPNYKRDILGNEIIGTPDIGCVEYCEDE